MYNRENRERPDNRNSSGGFNRSGGGGFQKRRPQFRDDRQPYKPAVAEGYALYYIAAVCSDDVNAEIKVFKDFMQKNFGCRAAQKSPAHLTVVPPFKTEELRETQMKKFVDAFNIGLVPFDIQLKGFSHFDDRVIFVDVVENENLRAAEQDCNKEFSEKFPSVDFKMKPAFNPHVTVATRDIPAGKFDDAWSNFKDKEIDTSFTCKGFELLKLKDGKWETI